MKMLVTAAVAYICKTIFQFVAQQAPLHYDGYTQERVDTVSSHVIAVRQQWRMDVIGASV